MRTIKSEIRSLDFGKRFLKCCEKKTKMSSDTIFFQTTEAADYYVKYRPRYGPDLYESIINFCKEIPSAKFSRAIDVGCGSGQSTVPLTKYFQEVIGLDVSEAQILKAPKNIPGLSFRMGPGEDLSFLESDSCDLVTVAAALHWMDLKRFNAEVERVLRPGGALVAYCYNKPSVDEPQAQEIINHFYTVTLQGCWAEAVIQLADNRYRGLYLPFPGWRRNDALVVRKHCPTEELVGYLRSLTACQTYLSRHPDSTVLSDITERLGTIYGDEKGEERKVQVTWSIFMLMGHKPLS